MAIILFDFDGVLADTLEDILNFGREASAQLGFKRDPSPADVDVLEPMSVQEYARQLKLPPQYIDEFTTRYLKMFIEKPTSPKLFPGMGKVVEETAKHHILAVVTGNIAPTVDAFLKQHGLRGYIKSVVGEERRGSKAEKIRIALKELGRIDEMVYMVGDSVSDIRAARETFIKSIAAGWGHQSQARLLAAHPDHFAKSPQELGELLRTV